MALAADLLDAPERRSLVRAATVALGGLDGLVNNACAIFGPAQVEAISEDAWQRTFTLNAEAPFFLAQQVFEHMRKNGGGRTGQSRSTTRHSRQRGQAGRGRHVVSRWYDG